MKRPEQVTGKVRREPVVVTGRRYLGFCRGGNEAARRLRQIEMARSKVTKNKIEASEHEGIERS